MAGITPLTLNMTMPMTENVSQTQNMENQRASVEHAFASNEAEKTQDLKRETVVQKDSLELSKEAYDAREKGKNEYFGDGGQKGKKNKAHMDEEDINSSEDSGAENKEKKKHVVHLDIKL